MQKFKLFVFDKLINFLKKKYLKTKIVLFYYYIFKFYLISFRRKNFYFSNIKYQEYWSSFLRNQNKNKKKKTNKYFNGFI